MRLYLDNCCLQRPLDNQSYPRIKIETESVFAVLAAVQAQAVILLGSEALDYEISRIPDESRRVEAMSVLSLASEYLKITDRVEALATGFEQSGLLALDAIHLALASEAKVDYFCTCDDKLFRKARTIHGLNCQVISLLGLIPEITK